MKPLSAKRQYAIDCIKQTDNLVKAAQLYGCNYRQFQALIKRIKADGYEVPETQFQRVLNRIPGQREGFAVKALSSMVRRPNEDGTVSVEWVKQEATHDCMKQFVEELCKRVESKGPKIKSPRYADTGNALFIPMGDPHFGMYAWSAETGEDYDTEIARSVHLSAISHIINSRPRFDQINIISLGDLLHADNRRQMTEKSGNLLDVDGRYRRVMWIVRDSLIEAIEMAAKKAKQVNVYLIDGNHDPHSSADISDILAAYYRKSKNIHINQDVRKQVYIEYGNNLIGLTHGDTTKSLASLPGLMSCDMREAWGRTSNHYWWTGHIHQQKVFEYPSCVVESFNSMTAKDAYAAEYGYRSRRQMTGIIMSKEHGEIERIMVRPEHFK